MNSRVTEERVRDVFREIVKKGQMPSASQIERALGIHYKSSTVFKYLQALKMRAYRRFIKWEEKELGFEEEEASSFGKGLELFKELNEKMAIFEEQNKLLSAELGKAEKEIVRLKEQNSNLEKNFNDITQKYQASIAQLVFLEKLCHEIKEERAMMSEAIAKEKNQQIEALQQELKGLHKEHLETIQRMGFEGDDALIREKVRAINLEDKLTQLTQTVSSLERELKKERDAHQPLIQRLSKQQALIEKTLTWEQLQEYEKLLKENLNG